MCKLLRALFSLEVAFIYWDISKALSYNCLFNFIIGARGVGKSYGAKKFVINDFIKNGNQFVYVRRFKEELKKIDKFYDDVGQEFAEHDMKVDGSLFFIDGEEAGTALALSTAKIEKSTPYPFVKTIIFDEFILDNGFHKYLPDEVTNFLELYSTIARTRDVRVFFLSNALTITNPYFIYFDISLPYGKNFRAKDDILIEMVVDNEYTEKAKNTRFGKMISGTPYGNYAIENNFLRDSKDFIQKKTVNSKYFFTFTFKGEKYGVWTDYSIGVMYVSKDVDPSYRITFSFTLADHSPNTLLLKGSKSYFVETFIKAYKLGLVRFESVNIKNICNEFIKMTL